MVNVKRAISPLIAAILLIAFTISIGVMIIGWGRQFVQQQVSCVGLSLEILRANYNVSNNKIDFLNLTIQNIGSASIVKGATKARVFLLDPKGNIIRVLDLYGNVKKIFNITENDDNTTFSPGEIYIFEYDLSQYNINPRELFQIYIDVQGCGKISNDYYP